LPQVIAGIQRLQAHAIPLHVITVLTRESLDYPDELFDFYLEFGIRQVAFNIEEIEGIHLKSSLNSPEICQRFAEFLERFYDLIHSLDEPFFVREFASTLALIMADTNPLERISDPTTPMAIVSVDCHGNFSIWSPELLGLPSSVYGAFALGNVMTDSFDAVFATPKFRQLSDDISAGVRSGAATCQYFPFCGGGAPVNKISKTVRSVRPKRCSAGSLRKRFWMLSCESWNRRRRRARERLPRVFDAA
jgi:uncharacterized protein